MTAVSLQDSRLTLVTVGVESPGQAGSCTIKFWDTAAVLERASGAVVQPSCTVKLFAQKLAEAEVTSAAVVVDKFPTVRTAIGLASGQVVAMLGSCQGTAQSPGSVPLPLSAS